MNCPSLGGKLGRKYYGLWVMGYGLWVMGYGLWVIDCFNFASNFASTNEQRLTNNE